MMRSMSITRAQNRIESILGLRPPSARPFDQNPQASQGRLPLGRQPMVPALLDGVDRRRLFSLVLTHLVDLDRAVFGPSMPGTPVGIPGMAMPTIGGRSFKSFDMISADI